VGRIHTGTVDKKSVSNPIPSIYCFKIINHPSNNQGPISKILSQTSVEPNLKNKKPFFLENISSEHLGFHILVTLAFRCIEYGFSPRT